MAASTAALLTLLMVPGAWYHSEHLELVRESLQSNFQDHETSHTVVVVDLPTADKINPGNYTKDDDAEHIRGQVTRLVDAGQDVVIFAHSYGGVPTSQVALSRRCYSKLCSPCLCRKRRKGGLRLNQDIAEDLIWPHKASTQTHVQFKCFRSISKAHDRSPLCRQSFSISLFWHVRRLCKI